MKFKTKKGHSFESQHNLETGDYVLLQTINGVSILDKFLQKEYVEEWSGSASTLEVDSHHIEVVA